MYYDDDLMSGYLGDDDSSNHDDGLFHMNANPGDSDTAHQTDFSLDDLHIPDDAHIQTTDTNGDGHPDSEYIDTNGDGTPDIVLHDGDGDGKFDAVGIDTNHDGIIDTAYLSTNGDGHFDKEYIDTTGSGVFDTEYIDSHDDGHYDTVENGEFSDAPGGSPNGDDSHDEGASSSLPSDSIHDIDNSSHVDYETSHVGYDSVSAHANDPQGQDLNGDGDITYMEVHTDSDHVAHEAYLDPDYGANGYMPAQFDVHSGTDGVIGNPADDMSHWHQQTHEDTCAVVSQEFVLDDLTGHQFNENELMQVAEEHGWYTPGGGTSMENVGNLLELYGLHTERGHGDMNSIEHALANGDKVIVGVDANEIWSNGSDSDHDQLDGLMGIPDSDANHAVEVIGVDHSDPNHPMVILNDPGTPGGQGAMIPMELFEQAWADSGNCTVIASK